MELIRKFNQYINNMFNPQDFFIIYNMGFEFTPNNQGIFYFWGETDNKVRGFYDLKKNMAVPISQIVEDTFTCGVTDKYIYTYDYLQNDVTFFDIEKKRIINKFALDKSTVNGSGQVLAFDKDTEVIILVLSSNVGGCEIKAYSLLSKEILYTIELPIYILSFNLSKDSKFISIFHFEYSSQEPTDIYIYDALSGE